ncbi:MAG: type II toxin-antitoxin system Phd/YefM family antitoxin [Clostridiales bacterium]|nr:type II toxin-antitoxin system Phd/YefM family antitoxin [Clostridiales bacterium]
MIVTATEFKTNIGRYLLLADSEEVLITKNGRSVAKLVSARDGKTSALRSLRGILKGADVSLESIRKERLAKYDESDD